MASVDGLAVALLAAGRSARFGEADKLAAPLGGRKLIDWAAEAGRSVRAAQRFLVTSRDAPYAPPGYRHVVNIHAEKGMATSLRIAAQTAEGMGASALLILLADMPFVGSAHLAALLDTFKADPARAVFSIAMDRPPQPPALFPAHCFPAVRALEGDKGARGLAGDAARVATTFERLFDIDTPDDLAQARDLIAAGKALI